MANRRIMLCLMTVALALAAGGSPSAAATSLDVELGWGGAYRAGRWSPLFITAADSRPRNVLIELYSPQGTNFAMRIRQIVTIGPQKTTFVLYAPLAGYLESLSVTLRDPSSGRSLADWTGEFFYGGAPAGAATQAPQAFEHLILVSGRHGAQRILQNHFHDNRIGVCSVHPLRLAASPQGYDSVSVLVLDQPDLTRLSREQQQAIVDWVRGGGMLVCWMSEDAQPPNAPIIDALPAVVGENIAISLEERSVREAGLPARFRSLKGRQLTPLPDAQRIPLFGDDVAAFRHRLGLGHVVLLPFDPSTFTFDSATASHAFWRPLLDSALDLYDPDSKNPYYNNPYNDAWQQTRALAASRTMDLLGDVPGIGRFGFSYVAYVLIGMMLVVGPIDWIVLKRLGRQPWTWLTTSGWIALVTLGAMFIGYVFKSGDLHYRTLRLIDQVDGMSIVTNDSIGIYSPRTRIYELTDIDPEGWWQPLVAEPAYYARGGMKTDIRFHQDYRGNRPEQMLINVWNLRFLTAQTIAPAPPVIEADLRYEHRHGANFVVGTIVNRGPVPLKNLLVRVKGGTCPLGGEPLPPGAQVQVNHRFTDHDRRFRYNPYNAHQYGFYDHELAGQYDGVWDIDPRRSRAIDRILDNRQDAACIYATADDVAPVARLSQTGAIEKHMQYVRAVVSIKPIQALAAGEGGTGP
ncbi:hypothetical protein [Fontivita pretiosa]|uniref:hypothetical protein n=1 Tax=Fontivita pretiosa TaxID=2989684 RepID=UPI003D17392A